MTCASIPSAHRKSVLSPAMLIFSKKSRRRELISAWAWSWGAARPAAKAAWQKAKAAWHADQEQKLRAQEAALATDRIRVLVVGHAYNLYDEYIGKPILRGIERLDALPVCSDAIDLAQAQKDSLHICGNVPLDHEP